MEFYSAHSSNLRKILLIPGIQRVEDYAVASLNSRLLDTGISA